MNSRILGKSGFEVSEIGLGCWQLGSDWGDGLSEEKAFSILEEAVKQGVTFFDTADVYGTGRSEKLIGDFLKNQSAEIRVATKFGRMSHVYPDNYTEDVLRKSIEDSCERLGVSNLDLIQLHCIPTEVMAKGDIFDWLRKLKSEGMIKAFGTSVETVDQGLLCIEQEEMQSLQVIFNTFRQKLVKELLPQAQEKGVGIIVRLPLASGMLTGKFNKDSQFAEGDHRNYNKDGEAFSVGETFAGIPFEKGLELTEKLRSEFLPEGMTMVDFALRWILDHDAVSTIIPGASSVNHVIGNARAAGMEPLPNKLHDKLSDFYKNEVHAHIRGVY